MMLKVFLVEDEFVVREAPSALPLRRVSSPIFLMALSGRCS